MDDEQRPPEARSFAEAKAIDINDEGALAYWSERLGATAAEIVEAVREVGANVMAVNLKLGAPAPERTAPPAGV